MYVMFTSRVVGISWWIHRDSFVPPTLPFSMFKVKSIELFDEIKAFLEYPFHTVSLLGFFSYMKIIIIIIIIIFKYNFMYFTFLNFNCLESEL
jgi:hypothetical protein